MVYGWLIDRVTDSTIQGLTNWLIDLWRLIDKLADSTIWGQANWLNDLWLAGWLKEKTDFTVLELTK